ncbi:hypothetical protein UFOVP168_37 [uncultured Caudovirales phage]|uniref:Uncharacterized protein n=1 Tax=uncultured Caudovirales phage TaxID=2100421 RepID=A0A6J7WF58_9CAUD|nr:hypothetical protein UFOVP168_37 [uncultured Caudovirales phage]
MFELRTMTSAVTAEQLAALQAKRAEAIKAAGTRWLLHPANYVERKTPKPKARTVLLLVGLFILAGVGNDCDGRCPAPTSVAP